MKISFKNVKKTNTLLDYISQLPLIINKGKARYNFNKIKTIKINGSVKILTNLNGWLFYCEGMTIIPHSYEMAFYINNTIKFHNIKLIEIDNNFYKSNIKIKNLGSISVMANIKLALSQCSFIGKNAKPESTPIFDNKLNLINSAYYTIPMNDLVPTKPDLLSIIRGNIDWNQLCNRYRPKKDIISRYDDPMLFSTKLITSCGKKYYNVMEIKSGKIAVFSEKNYIRKNKQLINTL